LLHFWRTNKSKNNHKLLKDIEILHAIELEVIEIRLVLKDKTAYKQKSPIYAQYPQAVNTRKDLQV
jgi:hypothetical protein